MEFCTGIHGPTFPLAPPPRLTFLVKTEMSQQVDGQQMDIAMKFGTFVSASDETTIYAIMQLHRGPQQRTTAQQNPHRSCVPLRMNCNNFDHSSTFDFSSNIQFVPCDQILANRHPHQPRLYFPLSAN